MIFSCFSSFNYVILYDKYVFAIKVCIREDMKANKEMHMHLQRYQSQAPTCFIRWNILYFMVLNSLVVHDGYGDENRFSWGKNNKNHTVNLMTAFPGHT